MATSLKNDDTRLACSCAVDSLISLAYAAGEDDPTPLVAAVFPAHKRIGYNNKTAVEIMDVEGSHFIVKERLYQRPPNPNIM